MTIDDLTAAIVGDLPTIDDPCDPDTTPTTWQPKDLTAALAGTVERTLPAILRRHDGIAMLYAGRINGLHADSGIGKSLLALYAATEVMADGGHVYWIDLEDPDETLVVERLRAFGVTGEQIAGQFHYVNPDEPASVTNVDRMADGMIEHGSCFVVIDSVGEALGLNGLHENDDLDVDGWKRLLPHRLERDGHTVTLIDHATKSADNPLHPSGSKRKRAMISGASWLVEQVTAFDREHPGKLKLTCAKDRHGNYRRSEVGAWVHVDPTGRHLQVLVEAPVSRPEDRAEAHGGSVAIMRKVVAAVKKAGPEGIGSKRDLLALVRANRVKASDPTISDAATLAGTVGCLAVSEGGSRGSITYRYVRDLTDADIEKVIG